MDDSLRTSNGAGRRLELLHGANSGAYRPTSVYDVNTAPSGIGYSERDRQRMLPTGQFLRNANGVSQSTWESRQKRWLDTPSTPAQRPFG